jgi:hypothetical protein
MKSPLHFVTTLSCSTFSFDPTRTYDAASARKTLAAEWGEELKLTPRNAAIPRNAVQRFQLEKTRLGIPVFFPSEALHGYMEYAYELSASTGAGQHV